MRLNKTPEQLKSIISKEELEKLYLVDRIDKETIANNLSICVDVLNKIITLYELKKENKHKKLEQLIEIVDKEEFIQYCNTHNIIETAKKYSTTTNCITQYKKYIGYERSEDFINAGRREKLNQIKNNRFSKLLDRISKEELKDLYINQDKTREEISNYYNVSLDILDEVFKYYNIVKSRKQIMDKNLNGLYLRFGGKDKYYEYFFNKRKENWIDKYGSFESFNSQRSEKIAASWESKSEEEKQTITNKILTNKSQNIHYKNSKPNLKFNEYLKLNILKYDENRDREFVLKHKSYDFKIGNSLLEINPTITHNVTWIPLNKNSKGLSKNYHINKSKLAYNNGYQCICIWDWDDWDKILKLISPEPKIDTFSIKEINIEEAKNFLDNNHIFGYVEDDIRLGVFIEDKLVSILTLEKLSENSYNILRIYNENYLLDLINYFVSNYNPSSIYYVCNLDKYVPDNFIKLGFELKDKDYNIYNIHINSNADVEIYGAGLEYYEWCKE